ncbi:C3a anaphylatoxin chemotactic receptor-like [Sinocyclocheilus anshuiensis]|uniref:C3a anaphylatoxin chemotactic receptor-like n=1 Tax=Sinocyclocheilus anshuiensis TaxID=1608454 RepID=UPI0007B9CD9E|nr:PREDICTED: C3a anaphylatoxin chemotactic receptor-like [Sinocyclocheilus anshuiensis]
MVTLLSGIKPTGPRRQRKIKTRLVPVNQQLKNVENTSFEAENMTRGTAANTTILQHEDFMSFMIFSLCILFSTIVVGLIGNGLVIFLTGCRMKTTVNSIWFLNLAIADFIFMLSSIIDLLSFLGQWDLYFMSYILQIMLTLNLFASILFLVVISLDRCLCTWMVVWAKNKRTLLKAKIICIIVWVSSIGCSIPFFNVHMFTRASLITCEFTVGFLIPFLIIASSYITIGVRIKRLKRGKQLRSFRVIITVILSFFICWFPYHACNLCTITAVKSDQTVLVIARTVSICLVHLNSCLNPILYVFMCDEYKKKLKQSLLLVLETAFAEDHLDFKGDAKERSGQENPTELLEM